MYNTMYKQQVLKPRTKKDKEYWGVMKLTYDVDKDKCFEIDGDSFISVLNYSFTGVVNMYEVPANVLWANKFLVNKFYPRGSVIPVLEQEFRCTNCGKSYITSILNPIHFEHVEYGTALCPDCYERGLKVPLMKWDHEPRIADNIRDELVTAVEDNSFNKCAHEAYPKVYKIYNDNVQVQLMNRDVDPIEVKVLKFFSSQGKTAVPYSVYVYKQPDDIIMFLPKKASIVLWRDLLNVFPGTEYMDRKRGWKMSLLPPKHK